MSDILVIKREREREGICKHLFGVECAARISGKLVLQIQDLC